MEQELIDNLKTTYDSNEVYDSVFKNLPTLLINRYTLNKKVLTYCIKNVLKY